ncbi:MAG: HAD family hydrolase [Calditrichia bacterium]
MLNELKPSVPQFDLIIYDLDGTLLDTRQDIHNAVVEVQQKLTLPVQTFETTVSYVGNGITKLLERSLPELSVEGLQQARNIFDAFYRKNMWVYTQVYPGVTQLLEDSVEPKMAVLSNKSQSYVRELVAHFKLSHHFTQVLGARSDMLKKPDPQGINHILKETNASPQRAILVGDTKNDILAGKAAGIYTCGVSYGFRSRGVLQAFDPDFLVDTVSELRTLFKLSPSS